MDEILMVSDDGCNNATESFFLKLNVVFPTTVHDKMESFNCSTPLDSIFIHKLVFPCAGASLPKLPPCNKTQSWSDKSG